MYGNANYLVRSRNTLSETIKLVAGLQHINILYKVGINTTI